MTAYRFCRTDDRALLIDAYEACRGPEAGAEPPLNVDEFKRLVRDLDLWCSSSMVAFEGRQAVGVLLGAKRTENTLLYGLRVHPEHRRKGHGRHLLTSLSQKLAILGPPKLLAEVPADSAAAGALFTACGWKEQGRFRDWRRPAGKAGPASPPEARESLAPVTLQELGGTSLESAGTPFCPGDASSEVPGTPFCPFLRPWARDWPALAKLGDRLQGLAFHSPERIAAWAFYLPPAESGADLELFALGAEPHAWGRLGLGALVDELAAQAEGGGLAFPRVSSDELAPALLAELGFEPGAEFLSFTTLAQPA